MSNCCILRHTSANSWAGSRAESLDPETQRGFTAIFHRVGKGVPERTPRRGGWLSHSRRPRCLRIYIRGWYARAERRSSGRMRGKRRTSLPSARGVLPRETRCCSQSASDACRALLLFTSAVIASRHFRLSRAPTQCSISFISIALGTAREFLFRRQKFVNCVFGPSTTHQLARVSVFQTKKPIQLKNKI